MKEVDFLPQWYQEGRRRQSSVKRQYVALAVLFLIMVVWNAFAVRSASLASAELSRDEQQAKEAERICYQFDHLVRQVKDCREGLCEMRALEGQLDLAAVLAELSTLIDGPLALESLEVTAERASEPGGTDPNAWVGGPVRFPVVMKGLAQDAPAVAEVLRRIEASECFRQVNLVISRNPGPTDGTTTADQQACSRPTVAFEIRCFLVPEQLPETE
jgi:hypothetical protein